jgi:hypothetical protein
MKELKALTKEELEEMSHHNELKIECSKCEGVAIYSKRNLNKDTWYGFDVFCVDCKVCGGNLIIKKESAVG